MDAWNDQFAERSPMLSLLRDVAQQIAGEDWPGMAVLQHLLALSDVRTAADLPLRLVPVSSGGEPYEIRLYACGELEFRERNWHDLFNVLSWLVYPRAKAALNARHHAEFADNHSSGSRGRVRDALTLFDEDGVVAVATDPRLLGMIRDFQWKPLFWEHRAQVVAGMRFLPFGHALCEKALAPYQGMTGRGLLLEVEDAYFGLSSKQQCSYIDGRVAQRIADTGTLRCPRDLSPVPVLGVPGWHADNDRAGYYDERNYFRPGRVSRPLRQQHADDATTKGPK